MKKLLSTLLLAAAVPATMLAKPLAGEQLKMNQIKVKPEVKSTFNRTLYTSLPNWETSITSI